MSDPRESSSRPPDDYRRRRADEDSWPPIRRKSSKAALWIVLGVVGVVLACGGISVFGLLFPAIQKYREAEARVQSASHLKQLNISVMNTAALYNGKAPPGYGRFPDADGREGSIYLHLLPSLDQNAANQGTATQMPLKVLLAPADSTNAPDKPWTSYAANEAVFGTTPHAFPSQLSNKGLSNTILFAERYAARNGPWADRRCLINGAEGGVDRGMNPPGRAGDYAHAFLRSGCQVGLADGAVRTLGSDVSDATFRWACDPQAVPNMPTDW